MKKILLALFLIAILGIGYYQMELGRLKRPPSLEEKFASLAQSGNSACSASFADSIATMEDSERLQGSCCSQMSWHRYHEQVEGLKTYSDIEIIPSDPYDISAALAKKLKSNYDMELSADEQNAYDFAMENSSEKGPCCCKCWRWFVYGGLGKILIRDYGFSGEQLTDVWNLSDGCGGDTEHYHEASQPFLIIAS